MREETQLMREQVVLRIGAICLVVGSMLIVVSRLLHGDLPADKGGAAALSYVASYPIYPLVHFADVVGFLIYAGGLVTLSSSLTHSVAWAIGRLGIASVLVGAAVHVVDFSIDGFGLPMLANAWAATSPSERPSLELGAQVVLAAIGGPSVIALIFVWGSTLAVYGLAVKMEGYSSWLGWAGVILGAVIFIMGTIFYLKPNIYPGALFYGGDTLLAHLWAIVLGIAMWRRATLFTLTPAPQQ